MKIMRHTIGLALLVSTVAHASPGWAEDSWTQWDGIFFVAILICNVSVLPLIAMEGTFRFGLYAWFQVPLQALFLGALILWLRRIHARARSYCMLIPVVYVLITFVTNVTGMCFEVDHKNDFPMGNYLTALNVTPERTRDQIVAHVGPPLAELIIDDATDIQPKQIQDIMRKWNRTNALVAAYQESASHDRLNTYYVLYDVSTTQQFTFLSIHKPLGNNDWPNHGLVRTGDPRTARQSAQP